MKKMLILLVSLVVVLNLTAQIGDKIINRHIKAIGGVKKWNALNTLYVEMFMDMGGLKVPVKIWQEHMKGMRVEFTVQDMTGIQVVTEKDGWSLMPFQGQDKAEPADQEFVKNQRSQLDIRGKLLNYKKRGSVVKFLGEEEDEGIGVYKLRLTEKNKAVTIYYIDKSNYLVLKTINTIKSQDKEFAGVTKFSNYKEIDGLLLPHSIDSNHMGKMEIIIREVNPVINAGIFAMPVQ